MFSIGSSKIGRSIWGFRIVRSLDTEGEIIYNHSVTGALQYLSKEKKEELEKEFEYLTTVRRKEIAEALEEAKSHGDLKENAEYHETRERQAELEERIISISAILRDAKVVKSHHSDTIEVGSIAIIQKEGEKEKRKFQIVGASEVDVVGGKISNESPIGLAMLGKKKDDNFSVKTNKGDSKYKIVDIE